MARSGLVSVDHAWQSVSLEERLELISRAHANGIVAMVCCVLLMGGIAYGFDEIWILAAGVAGSLFVFPLFSSYSWRREKPALILAYLAVRTVARRYAYGYDMPDIDIIFIYRARMKEVFSSKEEELFARQRERLDYDSVTTEHKDVWVVLLRGGIVILSEKDGGARLEFLTFINHDTVIRKPTNAEGIQDEKALVIEGVLNSKGRAVVLTSRYAGAHYVFERRLGALIVEQKMNHQTLEKLRTAGSASE